MSVVVKNKSPLRYPGGKTRAIKILSDVIKRKYKEKKVLLSPFFGGGSLELVLHGEYNVVKGNDLFSPLIVFWKVVQTRPNELSRLVCSMMPVSKEDFHTYRKKITETNDDLRIAALYFIINRCSFSGSTFCGGFSQQAAEKRLTLSSVERLEKVDLSNIVFSNMDVEEFLKQNPETNDTFLYADPPYYISSYIYGKDGDLHISFDHEKFASLMKKRRDWILCYNDCEFIRNLYDGCRIENVSWSYGMNKTKKSSEILIFPSSAT